MNTESFEEQIQAYWKKVQELYAPYVAEGGLLENRDYYVFQTEYRYQPELMIVGVNPGGNGTESGNWLSQGSNSYTMVEHTWFETVRNIFNYPDDQELAVILDSCVGSNKCFVNTGNQEDLPKEINRMSTLLIRELVGIVKPKHILTLGSDVFCTLKNIRENVIQFGSTQFKYSKFNETPVAYIPNPSRRNQVFFTPEKIKEWNDALRWFLLDTHNN